MTATNAPPVACPFCFIALQWDAIPRVCPTCHSALVVESPRVKTWKRITIEELLTETP